ncbi:MAG TPA: thiamine phosphate synthase, partial [Bacillota bacterium]|nr:thiamine phosphate synthase [Bacillota bacterium]
MNCAKESLSLYAVTDRSWLAGKSLVQAVEESLQGGITFLQLREKTLDYEAFLNEAFSLKALCAEYHVPFVINDNFTIALACDADGVHVGQSDSSVSQARAILGNHKIIGASVQTVAQALLAEKQGADYLGVGAIFPTSTKQNAEVVSYDL